MQSIPVKNLDLHSKLMILEWYTSQIKYLQSSNAKHSNRIPGKAWAGFFICFANIKFCSPNENWFFTCRNCQIAISHWTQRDVKWIWRETWEILIDLYSAVIWTSPSWHVLMKQFFFWSFANIKYQYEKIVEQYFVADACQIDKTSLKLDLCNVRWRTT